jgi:hypothetical protein
MKWVICIAVLITLILSGCAAPVPPSSSGTIPNKSRISGQFGEFSYGEYAKWPDYLPDDIPPIPADINTVIAGQDRIRIFFDGLPENEFNAYLQLLQKNGFSLQFIVYEEPYMSEGEAEAKLKQGNYDSVRITKGDYNMRIEYGNGQGTFDIDSWGQPEGTVIDSGPKWPQELAGILGAPDNCTIQSVRPGQDGGTVIMCESTNTSLFQDYMADLSSQGFELGKQSKSQNDDIIEATYIKGSMGVVLYNYRPGMIGITVRTGMDAGEFFGESINGGWPKGLPASLPEFPGAVVQSAIPLGDKTLQIMIKLNNAADIQAYRNLLLQSGFSSRDSDKNAFTNADCMVTIKEYMQADFFSLTVKVY